jgi:hypothetical protein
MMPISVISTTITNEHVTIIIGDSPDPDLAMFWLKFSAPLKILEGKTVAGIRQEALRALRNEVAVQSAGK